MKLIQPTYEIIEQQPGLQNMYKHIERCGRTCYKSEDKITDTSAEEFVNHLMKVALDRGAPDNITAVAVTI